MIAVIPQVISPRAISYVSCAIDGTEVGNFSYSPYTFDLNTTTYLNGNHNVTVAVMDEIGQKGHAQVTTFFDNPFDIQWGLGNVTHFNSTPERIISLGSSFTEILYAIGADSQIVGVDTSSIYPEAALSKNQTGSSSNPTREVIASLHPDCIIIWSYNMNFNLIVELSSSYKVVGYYPKNIADCEKVIVSIGNLTGKNHQAVSLVNSMEARLNAVVERIASIPVEQRPSVYYEQANGKSVGNGSLGNEIITRAGGRNIYWNSTLLNPTFSLEYPRDANPDFIIIDNASVTTNEEIAARAGWDSINAVQNGHIYRINARMMSITPRIVDAIEQMMEWFYPI
jgi:iron complex transport system substrate-binding protein